MYTNKLYRGIYFNQIYYNLTTVFYMNVMSGAHKLNVVCFDLQYVTLHPTLLYYYNCSYPGTNDTEHRVGVTDKTSS